LLGQIAPPDFAPVSSADVAVNVPANGAAVASFGNLRAGTVSGTVFNDLNGNGIQDAGEGGISGVTLELRDSRGNLVATAVTGNDGAYLFAGIAAGDYSVVKQNPQGSTSTTADKLSLAVKAGGEAVADFGECVGCETEPLEYEPPLAYKTVSGDRPTLEWGMTWTNRDNSEGILVHIEVPIPDELTYIEGSLGAEYGNFWYDKERNTIVWEGIIPGNGGTVKIWYETAVPDDVNHVENQACAVWDRNGNGDWKDEAALSSERILVCTDNPDSSVSGDATGWTAPEPQDWERLMKPF
ncbi:MAG: hypothetical protein BWK80_15790, partial [Desulfobacteraceae bacterium IS3]